MLRPPRLPVGVHVVVDVVLLPGAGPPPRVRPAPAPAPGLLALLPHHVGPGGVALRGPRILSWEHRMLVNWSLVVAAFKIR